MYRLAGLVFLFASVLLISARAQQTTPAPAQTAGGNSSIQKSVEEYLRHLYAFGPDVQLTFSPLKDTGISGLLETTVDLKMSENSQQATLYVSKDGKFLLRGEMSDLTKDPLAEARAKLKTDDSPSLGDAKATVTMVEFSDFECPICRQLHDVLRGLLPKYPQVRLVFKDFPIEQIHPWARTAALAGRCAYQQDHKAFWKMYDLVYDHQDLIAAGNAWDKMLDYAGQSGLNLETFKGCMSRPEAGAAIDASRQNALELEVGSTPTIFINGRRLIGADARAIEQYIQYELAQQKQSNTASKKQ